MYTEWERNQRESKERIVRKRFMFFEIFGSIFAARNSTLSPSFPSVCDYEVMGWHFGKPNLHNHLLNSESSCDKHQLTVTQDNLTKGTYKPSNILKWIAKQPTWSKCANGAIMWWHQALKTSLLKTPLYAWISLNIKISGSHIKGLMDRHFVNICRTDARP